MVTLKIHGRKEEGGKEEAGGAKAAVSPEPL